MDEGSFYQVANGVPVLQPCPAGLVFKPLLNVCDWPRDIDQAQVYDSAVSKGLCQRPTLTQTGAAPEIMLAGRWVTMVVRVSVTGGAGFG